MESHNILLFESRNDSLLPIAIILEMHGYHTAIFCDHETGDGWPGSSKYSAKAIDLLITDTPAHVLGELEPGSVPVLVLVNPENISVFSVIRKKGFQFLEKPVEPGVLLGKMSAMLEGGNDETPIGAVKEG